MSRITFQLFIGIVGCDHVLSELIFVMKNIDWNSEPNLR